MAEHMCACHRVLGDQPDEHEWETVALQALEYVGLCEYDFDYLKGSIRKWGVS